MVRKASAMPRWKPFSRQAEKEASRTSSEDDLENGSMKHPKWSLGVLNDKQTDEVPGKSDQPGRYKTCLEIYEGNLFMTDDYFQVPFCCYRKSLKEMNPLAFIMLEPERRPRPSLLHTFPARSHPT